VACWCVPCSRILRPTDAGLMPGDVITAVGSTPVRSLDAFMRNRRDLDAGEPVPLRLMRRGSPLFIGLRLED
jgi:serine protease Do